jgi:hypothetical protein
VSRLEARCRACASVPVRLGVKDPISRMVVPIGQPHSRKYRAALEEQQTSPGAGGEGRKEETVAWRWRLRADSRCPARWWEERCANTLDSRREAGAIGATVVGWVGSPKFAPPRAQLLAAKNLRASSTKGLRAGSRGGGSNVGAGGRNGRATLSQETRWPESAVKHPGASPSLSGAGTPSSLVPNLISAVAIVASRVRLVGFCSGRRALFRLVSL